MPVRSELFTLLLLASSAVASEGVIIDRIAAVVNDDVVTLSDIYALGSEAIDEACPSGSEPTCRPELELEVLDAIIRRTLIRQELVRLEYDVGADDVDAAIQQMVRDYDLPDRETLRSEVERSGATWAEFREENVAVPLRRQRFQELVLRNRVSVSTDEVLEVYRRLVREVEAPLVARLSAFGYVLPRNVTPQERIAFITEFRAIFATVAAGGRTWESVVEEYDTAKVAGVFADKAFAETDLTEALSAAAFQTPVGTIAEPVLANNVLYGLQVLSRDQGKPDVPEFEAAKPEIEQSLFFEKLDAAEDEWYEVAKRQASVRVLHGASSALP
jgi:peptidyl-prolyl cis-trans isomerase SurA